MVAEMVKDQLLWDYVEKQKFLTRRKPGLQQFKFLNIIFHIIKPRRLNRFSVGLLVYQVVSVCIESRHQRVRWILVPILANPDIVERYSDNVVDTLHRKNLLLWVKIVIFRH